MEKAYSVINDVLVNLINQIWQLEEKAIITEEFQNLTNNDMHVIEAIGLGKGNYMSAIAGKLNITVGSLTTAVNNLEKKKYVQRKRSDRDRRVVFVRLTEKGVRAYLHHEDYHRQLTQAIMDNLDEQELPVLVKTLDALTVFFSEYAPQFQDKDRDLDIRNL